MRILRLLGFVALCAMPLLGQAEWPRPKWEKVHLLECRASGTAVTSTVGNFEVRLIPSNNAESDPACQAYLVDKAGHQTSLLADRDVSVYEGTGEDIFGKGNLALILEGFSGGAHCCYTYQLVDLAEKPVILSPIENASPFFFFKDPASKQFRIMASDGAFDYFDGMCHACGPFPRIILRADDAGLHNVSADFVEQYDSEIALARARIGNGKIGKFEIADFNDVKGMVLEIVFSYLYSRREQQAWQSLDEMWPPKDRERIKNLIVKTRAKGLLSELSKVRAQTISAASVR